jgi:hypothetical protein
MSTFKVFTWNMQRGQSISLNDNTISQRYQLLHALVSWADFGFITEPGRDIRDGLNNFQLPGLDRNFCVSQLPDNQSDGSACRPVVFSKRPFVRFPLQSETYIQYLSGADQAYRYPAAGIVRLDQHDGEGHQDLLLLSFHATSGFGANDNCQAYFDSFYQNVLGWGGSPTAVPLVWIVGGDFNCPAGRAIYMPITSTHQSGHIIDGFFADQNGTNFEVRQIAAAQTWTGNCQFITNPNVNPRGLVINGLHLSDHCPVIAQLQIAPIAPDRDAVNPANILATKRTRRKSTKMDIDKY